MGLKNIKYINQEEKSMKRISIGLMMVMVLLLSFGCGKTDKTPDKDSTGGTINEVITSEEAKIMMDKSLGVIVDVRTPEEFNEGHIENAINLPVDEIEDRALEVLPNKKETYLLYCRSGNRSAQGAKILENMGYEIIYDFGGINDWPYDIVK